MVELKFLHFLYPLYKTIHVYCPFLPYFQWGIVMFVFLQFVLLELYIKKPSEYFTGDREQRLFHYTQSFFYFLPWLFGSITMEYDSWIWLCFNILFIIYTIILAILCHKKANIPHFFLIWCRLYPQLIVPIMTIPLVFRISYVIECLLHNTAKYNVDALILYIVNLLIFIFTQMISSIFLLPYFFVSRSVLDVYDGKSHVTLYLIQILYSISIILLPIWRQIEYQGLITIVHFFFLFILLYYRMLTTVHVSLYGQFFELAPLFSLPFMILMHLYGPSHWLYFAILLFAIQILFTALMLVTRKTLKNSAFRVFSGFIYYDPTMANMPGFLLLKLSSSIRLIAKYNSDPSVLNRFLEYQRKRHLRTSSFIEICRFLSLFPEYRRLMYEQISVYSTKSIHNHFILHMFGHILEAINSSLLPKENEDQLELYYKSIICHSYLYWNARKNKKFFRAFFESFSCAYLIHELKRLIGGLMYLYPFNPNLHKYYAEVLLNIDGKFDGYKKELMFSDQLKKDHSLYFDPLFHKMALQNPKILQYCRSGISINNSCSSSELYSVYSTSMFKKNKKKSKSKSKDKDKTKSIASKIIRSKRKIPYMHIFHYILPSIFALTFVIYSNSINNKIISKSKKVFDSMDSVQKSYYSIVSSMIFILSMRNYTFPSLKNEAECQRAFSLITFRVREYYSNSPFISGIGDSIIVIAFHELTNLALKSNNVCYIVQNMIPYIQDNIHNHFAFVYQDNQKYLDYFENVFKSEKLLLSFNTFVFHGSIFIIIFLIIYFVSTCITLNVIMGDNENVINYLSSDKRLSLVFQNPESRDNLWRFTSGIDLSANYSDSTLHFEYESEMETTSHFTSSPMFEKDNSYHSPNNKYARSTVQLIKQSSDSPSAILSKNSDGYDTDFNDNNKKRMRISNSSLSGSVTSIRRDSKVFIPKSQMMLAKSNDDNVDSNSNAIEVIITSSNLKSTESDVQSSPILLSSVESNKPVFSLEEKNGFIENCKKQTWKYSLYSIIITILFPWIIVYFLILISYFPLTDRRKYEFLNGRKKYLIARDYNNALLLLREGLKLFYSDECNVSALIYVNNIFLDNLTSLSNLYLATQCFYFDGTHCFSVHSIVQNLINNDYTQYYLEYFVLPMLMNFTEIALKDMFLETNENIFGQASSGSPFIAIVVISGLLFILLGFVNSKELMKGLNSLFHFPGKDTQFTPLNSTESNPKIEIENDKAKSKWCQN